MARPCALLLLLLLLCAAASSSPAPDPLGLSLLHRPPPRLPHVDRNISELYFAQSLDHFSILDDRTWQQRYFVNDDYYEEGGPIFLFLNGEWAANGHFTTPFSFMGRLAEEHSALAIDLEHRYYGLSHPTPDMSTENLRYLTVDQALEDAANFAQALTTQMGLTGRWVVFGVSYSADLAAWARARYPHLFHAAYASSAPVLAKVDFYEYHEGTGYAMGLADPQCPLAVSEAMAEMQALIYGESTGLHYVEDVFNICKPGLNVDEPMDVMTLFSVIANFFGTLVQYAGPDGQRGTCDRILHGPGSTLENMATIVLEGYGDSCLNPDYEFNMAFYRNITFFHPSLIVRQLLFQMCTEFGWFWSLSSPDQPFGQVMTVDYFLSWCPEVFGPQFTPELLAAGVARLNLLSGGLRPDVTRVLYTHGPLDQWFTLGISSSLGPDTPVIVIEGGSHSWDMGLNVTSDPPELVEAREQAAQILAGWLQLP